MSTPRRTPDWLLERIAQGELPPDALAAARARLSEEPDGAARLAALEADTRATLEKLPPDAVAREVARRSAREEAARRERPRPFRRLAPALGLVPVLAAVALFVVMRPSREDARDPRMSGGGFDEGGVRSKGLAPHLVVRRQGPAGPEPLVDGAPAAAGDVVQLAYVAAGRGHGVILSIDGRGAVTLHTPEDGVRSQALLPSGTHPLSGAYELDDAPDFERFFLITSDAPFDLQPVLDAARALAANPRARTAPLVLPQGLTEESFTLEKQK